MLVLRHAPTRPGAVSREAAGSGQAENKNPEPTEKSYNYEGITSRNLFGTAAEAPGIKEKKDLIENLAPTTLDVVLVGTVAGDNDEKRAIILEKGQMVQEIYHIGDSIKGAIVKDILRGKVVLNFNNKDEILAMSEGKGRPPDPAATNRQQKGEIQPPSPVADPDVSGTTRIDPVLRKAIPHRR